MFTIEALEKKNPNHRKHLILTHFLNLSLQPNNLVDVQACYDSLPIETWLYLLKNQLVPSKLLLQHVARQVLTSYPLYIEYLTPELISSEIHKVDITALTWVYLHKFFKMEIKIVSGDLEPLLAYLETVDSIQLDLPCMQRICDYYRDEAVMPLSVYKHVTIINQYFMLNKKCLIYYHRQRLSGLDQYESPLIYAGDVNELISMLHYCDPKHVHQGKSILEKRIWSQQELSLLFEKGLDLPNSPVYTNLLENIMQLPSSGDQIYEYYYQISLYLKDLKPLLKDKQISKHQQLSLQVLNYCKTIDVEALSQNEQFTISNMKHYDLVEFLDILKKCNIKLTSSVIHQMPLIPLKDGEFDMKTFENIKSILSFAITDKNSNSMTLDAVEFGTTPLHTLAKRFVTHIEKSQSHTKKKNAFSQLLQKLKSSRSNNALDQPTEEYVGCIDKDFVQMLEIYIYTFDHMCVNWNVADKNGHYPLCSLKDIECKNVAPKLDYADYKRVELSEFIKERTCASCKTVAVDSDAQHCPICRDLISNNHFLPCGHEFCGSCINQWLENQQCCPYCRRKAEASELKKKE
eukprot:NODE_144_length_15804_cov_0.729131.p2 type:complete len:575 gc:universal NODE_144_length_15804_cov_0.729131:5839-4115(-)